MSDSVERLTKARLYLNTAYPEQFEVSEACAQACDEIERLRAERDHAIDHRNTAHIGAVQLKKEHGEMNVELIANQAEIERLRAALGRYASEGFWQNDYAEAGGVEVPVPYTAEAFYDRGEIARNVLNEQGEERAND